MCRHRRDPRHRPGLRCALAEKGATVFVTGRSDGDGELTIQGTVAAIEAAGGKGFGLKVDHGVDSEIEAFFAKVAEQAGKIDILVNNVYKIPHLPPGVAAFGIIPCLFGTTRLESASRALRRELACGAAFVRCG